MGMPTKPNLTRNAIAMQMKKSAQSLTIGEWNSIVNILKEQTNNNTKYLEDLHRLLFFDYENADNTSIVENILQFDTGFLVQMRDALADAEDTVAAAVAIVEAFESRVSTLEDTKGLSTIHYLGVTDEIPIDVSDVDIIIQDTDPDTMVPSLTLLKSANVVDDPHNLSGVAWEVVDANETLSVDAQGNPKVTAEKPIGHVGPMYAQLEYVSSDGVSFDCPLQDEHYYYRFTVKADSTYIENVRLIFTDGSTNNVEINIQQVEDDYITFSGIANASAFALGTVRLSFKFLEMGVEGYYMATLNAVEGFYLIRLTGTPFSGSSKAVIDSYFE